MNLERLEQLEAAVSRAYPNITGIVVRKNNTAVYENHWNGFSADDAVHVFSVTKSVVSALIGIAIAQGGIESVDQNIWDFFPACTARDPAAQNVTIRQLLTMTAPFRYKEEPYEAFFASENWVGAALDFLGGEYTGQFLYSPIIGAHILSGILVRATGQPVLDFAREHLFLPLGIADVCSIPLHSRKEQFAFYAEQKHAPGWIADPQGVHTASWGLALTPADLAKIGQLYANGGSWAGRQLLPASWIAESTRMHSRCGNLSYGYLWWVVDEQEGSYAALGDGGNAVYVNPEKQLVVSIAALFTPNAPDSVGLIQQYIEPMFEME